MESPESTPSDKRPVLTLARISLEQLLRDVEEAETTSGLFEDAPNRRFVYGECIGATQFFEARNQVGAWMRLLEWRRYARVFARRASVRSPAAFQRPWAETTGRFSQLRVRCNVVAFYPAEQVVCKIYYESGTAADFETRAVLAARGFGAFRVPDLLLVPDVKPQGRRQIRWYEYIPHGPSPFSPEETARRVMVALCAWYEQHGVDWVTPARLMERRHAAFEAIGDQHFASQERAMVRQVLDMALNTDHLLPEGWIHNDPVLQNVTFDDEGRLVLYDWEWSTRHALILDVDKISSYGGEVILDAYDEWMERIRDGTFPVCDARLQRSMLSMKGLDRMVQLEAQALSGLLPPHEAARALDKAKTQVLNASKAMLAALHS